MSLLQKLTTPLVAKVLGGALVGSLILSGILGILLATTRAELGRAKEVIRDLEGWQGQMVTAIGLASGNPDVTKDTAQLQVQELGNLRVELKARIEDQNAAIEKLRQQTEHAREVAERERQYRIVAVKSAETIKLRFDKMAETTVPREEMETRIREMQDQLWEAGL